MIDIYAIEQYTSEKILSMDEAAKKVEQLKAEGKTIGMCHGGFDLTHPGHIKHFESAKKLCDVLVVSITADKFIAGRKGSGRPIYPEQLRAYIIASIGFVDYTFISDFKKGVEVINKIKPSFYIKGPDFIHKTTPGITAEREAIKAVGGEIRYTTDPPSSTTKIINYIKNEVKDKQILILIDRDGTIIENRDFLGRNPNWKEEIKYINAVINYISYLQTKFRTTKIVVTNQTGVARRFFTCEIVEEINNIINQELIKRGIKIDNWQYCPCADLSYSKAHPEFNCDPEFTGEKTKRKPSTAMVLDALKELNKDLKDFDEIIVLGDSNDDKGLADNLKAKFIDVTGKSYEELVKEFS